MSEKKELESVIKSIRSGLKKYSQQFDEAAEKYLDKKEENKKEVDYIIEIVCDEYAITRRTLIYSNARGSVQDAKHIAYCLLHLNLGLPIRHIAKRIFFKKWHNIIAIGIKRYQDLNEKVRTDREFKERYEKLQNKFTKTK